MINSHQPENIKECPECGTNLIANAKHCAVCGYIFMDAEPGPLKNETIQRRPMVVMVNLPVILGMIFLLVAVNLVVIFGLQKRDQTKIRVASDQATSTYIATTFVSPTPLPTDTYTPAPPTITPVVYIEYVVVSGDSCISIAERFNIFVDSLLAKNDIDCATLNIGTVLRIPPPAPTPASEVTSTAAP
jgi:LysM repeat protein/rubredoxin